MSRSATGTVGQLRQASDSARRARHGAPASKGNSRCSSIPSGSTRSNPRSRGRRRDPGRIGRRRRGSQGAHRTGQAALLVSGASATAKWRWTTRSPRRVGPVSTGLRERGAGRRPVGCAVGTQSRSAGGRAVPRCGAPAADHHRIACGRSDVDEVPSASWRRFAAGPPRPGG